MTKFVSDIFLMQHKKIVQFIEGHCREDLDTDRKLNLSLVRLLEIIGETARGTTTGFRQKHSVWPECAIGLFMAILTLISRLYGRR